MTFAIKPVWLDISSQKKVRNAVASVSTANFFAMLASRKLNVREVRALLEVLRDKATQVVADNAVLTCRMITVLTDYFDRRSDVEWTMLEVIAKRPELTGKQIGMLLAYLDRRSTSYSKVVAELISNPKCPEYEINKLANNSMFLIAILRSGRCTENVAVKIMKSSNYSAKHLLLTDSRHSKFAESLDPDKLSAEYTADLIARGVFSDEKVHSLLYHPDLVVAVAAADRLSSTANFLKVKKYALHIFGFASPFFTSLIADYVRSGRPFGTLARPSPKRFKQNIAVILET